jgi:Cu2+-containing amine oxidase
MDVSMDGLRNQMVRNYNSLVKKLNKNIDGDEITIEHYAIQNELDALRNCIVTLAFTRMDGEGGWKEMDENTEFETFNEQQ